MPIYEYECPTHGRFEVNQRISEDALKTCTIETCGQPVRKLISSTSFALKGGGWYSDGYGSSGGGSSSGGGKSEAAGACGSPASCGAGACEPKAMA
jgi:putative FmdB family regulatory protein